MKKENNICSLCGGYEIGLCSDCPSHIRPVVSSFTIWIEDVLKPFKVLHGQGVCVEDVLERQIRGQNRLNIEKIDNDYFIYGRQVIIDIKTYQPLTRKQYYQKYEISNYERTPRIFSKDKRRRDRPYVSQQKTSKRDGSSVSSFKVRFSKR